MHAYIYCDVLCETYYSVSILYSPVVEEATGSYGGHLCIRSKLTLQKLNSYESFKNLRGRMAPL